MIAYVLWAFCLFISADAVTICEGNSQTISCPSGTMTINSANYGRTDGSTCGGSVYTTSCYASSSLSVVRNACNGRSSCTLNADNGVFGDPCVGTYKYLAVSYACSVNGGWSSWSSWGSCSLTCGSGSQSRTRSCTNPSPSGGGSSCSGSSSSSQSCNTHSCPINGAWTAWGSWGTCSVTCGGGSQGRGRSCTNPAPQHGGTDCSGSTSSTQDCNMHNCPINGAWTAWGSWDTCSVTCGGGSQGRSRSCTNPAPQYGGTDCSGSTSSTQDCNTHNCPIDGEWTTWGAWGSCTVTCGGGTQVRSRTCSNPAPQYGGANCVGDSTSNQDCNTQVCIIDGAWGAWKSWGSCTVTCGGGKRSRLHECDSPLPANGGLPCPGSSSDFENCNTAACPTVASGTYVQLCPTGWFTCQSGAISCIDESFKCDCSSDCDDGSDETVSYAKCSQVSMATCQNSGSMPWMSFSAFYTCLFPGLVGTFLL